MKFNKKLEESLVRTFREELDMNREEMMGTIEDWINFMGDTPPSIRKRMSMDKIQRRVDTWMMKRCVENWGVFNHWLKLKDKVKSVRKDAMSGLVEF